MNKENIREQISRIETENFEIANSDRYRPKFHLMPPVGWMNDPNGLCWYNGRYHVYFQYSPLDAHRGEIYWGHWSSDNLINWVKHPVFLYPEDEWDKNGVYSGSALVQEDGLYLYYTGNVKYEGDYDYINEGRGHNVGLAITTDTEQPDSNVCILKNSDYPDEMSCHVRDPKVWEQDGSFYMVLGGRTRQSDGVLLVYTSKDRVHWDYLNTIRTDEHFGYMWECPDLFELDGHTILSMSPQGVNKSGYCFQNVYSCGYLPVKGDFRGACKLGEYQEADAGFDYYAPQSFVAPDGRRIAIGWAGMPDADYYNPTADSYGWQHCMSVPRELRIRDNQVVANPVKEIETLRNECKEQTVTGYGEITLFDMNDIIIENQSETFKMMLGKDVTLSYEENVFKLNLSEDSGFGRKERIAYVNKLSKLRILVDTSIIEIFINDGEKVMTTRFYPQSSGTVFIHGNCNVTVYGLTPMSFEMK